MSEALTAEPLGPQTDTLIEQPDAVRPVEVKTEPKTNLDDTLKAEVDKAVKGREKPEEKAEPKPEAKEQKPDEAKVETKPEAAQPTKDKNPPADAQQEAKSPVKTTAYKEPPSGFDDAAKKEWEAVPESVRGAVHRRAQEMERGIHKYRQDAEQFDSVRQYAEQAKQSGTDLPTALSRYTALEQQLRTNPMQGLQAVVANLGLKKSDGSQITLRDVAATIMGQTPDQAASRQEATINQLTQQVQSLTQQLGGFSKHVETQQHEAKATAASGEWEAFTRDHPRAAELETAIAEALQMQNADAYPSIAARLRHAYAVAEAENPSVAHTDPLPLAQTQTPDRQPNPAGQKSVSGTGGESRPVRPTSSDDAIKKAIAKLRG